MIARRLAEDEGVINRCGFNSDGLKAVQQRLRKREASPMLGRAGLLGINVGKNKLSEVRMRRPYIYYFILLFVFFCR